MFAVDCPATMLRACAGDGKRAATKGQAAAGRQTQPGRQSDSRMATASLHAALREADGDLRVAMSRLNRGPLPAVIAWFMLESVAIVVLPICTFYLLNWVETDRISLRGYGWAAGMALASLVALIARDQWQQTALAAGQRLRAGVCGVVLHKATRLHISALDDSTLGELSHLMGHQAEALSRLFYSKVSRRAHHEVAGRMYRMQAPCSTTSKPGREESIPPRFPSTLTH